MKEELIFLLKLHRVYTDPERGITMTITNITDVEVETTKRPGFSAIAETIKAEVSETEAKRDKDRRFIKSLIKDAAGSYNLGVNPKVNQVSQGLTAEAFTRESHDLRAEIVSILKPRLNDSSTLRKHAKRMNTAVRAAETSFASLECDWDNYLREFFPEVMQRLEETECQFKTECKRSLTYIALRLELESIKEIFNIPLGVACDDDDEWI